ncbi:MAG: hypothetical protein ACREHV_04040 [Rhizomicrobium sp.]
MAAIDWGHVSAFTPIVLVFLAVIPPVRRGIIGLFKSFRDFWLLMRGEKGVDDLRAPLDPLSRRMRRVERDVRDLKTGMGQVLTTVGRLESLAAETNLKVSLVDRKVTPNGEITTGIGDAVKRLERQTPAGIPENLTEVE